MKTAHQQLIIFPLFYEVDGKQLLRFRWMLPWRNVSRRLLATCNSPPFSYAKPWLFVGLGNPGEKYKSTRHNVGFDMIDAFAKSVDIPVASIHCKALFGQGLLGTTPILLAKPQTYMNLSGESAGPLAAYYKLPLDRVLLIYDDMDLDTGVIRLQPRGGHGGHRGVSSVIYHFRGNKEFSRLRIGIGKPPGQMDPKAYVLQEFNATARLRIDAALQEGVKMLKTLVEKGFTECIAAANTAQKYKHSRLGK